jgi:hypothetical protein
VPLLVDWDDGLGSGPRIDTVTASCTRAAPTPTNTPGGNLGEPPPGEDDTLTVTGDPRFPVTGSAAL